MFVSIVRRSNPTLEGDVDRVLGLADRPDHLGTMVVSPGAVVVSRWRSEIAAREWLAGAGPTLELLALGRATSAEPSDPGEQLYVLNNELATMAREHAQQARELRQANARHEATLAKLRETQAFLLEIAELLPLCLDCGKVKAHDGTWKPLLAFLHAHQVTFSHGYCPPCAEQFAARVEAELQR